jgi:hypothetical protein
LHDIEIQADRRFIASNIRSPFNQLQSHWLCLGGRAQSSTNFLYESSDGGKPASLKPFSRGRIEEGPLVVRSQHSLGLAPEGCEAASIEGRWLCSRARQ